MSDRIRQALVTAGAVFMIFGTLYGFGLIGTPVEQSAGGSLSAEATLLAPAVRAFSIWSVIYIGLIGYVVWQWLPGNTASPRARRIGWLSALSMALNGLWLLVVQASLLWLSVAVIVALAITLGELMRRLGGRGDTTAAERLLVDGTFGLYLGWVAVATARECDRNARRLRRRSRHRGVGVSGRGCSRRRRCTRRHPREGARRADRRGRSDDLGPVLDRRRTPHR